MPILTHLPLHNLLYNHCVNTLCVQALSQWMTDWAVLPVENSLGGSIHTVYDLLLRYRLHIVGETSVAVNHCLLALPGTKKEDLKRVISHPQVRSTAVHMSYSKQGTAREYTCIVHVDSVYRAGLAQAALYHGRLCCAVSLRQHARMHSSSWPYCAMLRKEDYYYRVWCALSLSLLSCCRRWLRWTTT